MTRIVSVRRAVVLLLLVGSFLYSLTSMPLLYYDIGIVERPCGDPRTLDLEGLTVFVGDLHLSGAETDSERFRGLAAYVKARSVTNLVVLGDLFAWRNDYDSLVAKSAIREEAIKPVLDGLGLMGQKLTVYLILGDPGHDPEDLNVNLGFGETRVVSLGKCAIFHIRGLTIIGLHGDQAFGGPFGFAVSILTRNLLLERVWKQQVGVSSDIWVIMAHTHVPGVDYRDKVANTGGWTGTPLIRAPGAMGVVVDECGSLELIAF